MTTTEAVRSEVADGIVNLILDDPNQSANTMNPAYREAMDNAINRLADEVKADPSSIKGVIVSSAKKTFFAGGDLKLMTQATPDDAEDIFNNIEGIKATLRKLETVGKPVVAAINGAALGGGLEIALACHHRIALDDRYEIGLPEVTLGLLPGGGGVTRTVRMLGIGDALLKVLLQGQRMKPAQAKEVGIIDEVVATQDDLIPAAKAWIEVNVGNEEAHTKAWDRKGYRMPGGTPTTPAFAANLPAFPANLRKQVKGAAYKAPKNILSAAIEGASVDFDTASRIESRYLIELIVGQQFKKKFTKVPVLGAGMMGAGIAYVSAKAGIEVVLKDVSIEAAEKGKAYSEKLLAKQLEKGRITQEKKDAFLALITPTADYADLKGCDLVVEAVFESVELKHAVFGELEPIVNSDARLRTRSTMSRRSRRRLSSSTTVEAFSPAESSDSSSMRGSACWPRELIPSRSIVRPPSRATRPGPFSSATSSTLS